MNDPKQNGRFDSYLESLRLREAGATATRLTLTPEPDKAAEAEALGRELGLPAAAILGAPDQFRASAQQKRLLDNLKDAPKTREWLMRDLTGAGMAKDDIENLTWYERNANAFGRAGARGVRRIGAADDFTGAVIDEQIARDIGRSREDIFEDELAELGDNPLPEMIATARQTATARYEAAQGMGEEDRAAVIQRGAASLSEARRMMAAVEELEMSPAAEAFKDGELAQAMRENTVSGTFAAFARDPIGGAAFMAETVAEFLPALVAGTAATAVTRNPASGAIVMGSTSGLSEMAASAMDFLTEKGVDLSTPEAAAAVLQDQELMREAAERGLARGLVIGIFDAVSGGVAGTRLLASPAGDLVAQGIAQAALGAGGEATAQAVSGQDADMASIVIEGMAEIVGTPLEMAGPGGRRMSGIFSRYARSGETAKTLTQIDERVAASKLRERNPEKFEQALAASGLGQQAIYFPADELREYFQAKDMAWDRETLEAFGVDFDEFEAAVETGGDVSIPASTYASRISNTEDAAFFAEHGRFSPDEYSAAEIRNINDEIAAALEYERTINDLDSLDEIESRPGDTVVRDALYNQLRNAGRSPDVAEREALVLAAGLRTFAGRSGMTTEELAGKMGLRIEGPATPEARRRRDTLDIQLNTLRREGKKLLKPKGQSLTEFIVSRGGLSDEGGDVAAIEGPKGLVAETREQILERRSQPNMMGPTEGRGQGLDDAGRAALDAGFFSDIQRENADGTEIDTAALLLDALQREASGERFAIAGEEADPTMTALAEDLSRRGLDIETMTNDEIIAAMGATEGDTTLNQGEDDGPRGSIQFPATGGVLDGRTVINLFESANLSTLLHESGHLFLETMRALSTIEGADPTLTDDLRAVEAWLGIKEPGATPTTEQHEKFARGFEAYLLEGKAPSLDLQDAFARFKAWLTRIYRTVTGLNVSLTDDVRAVFDRMLATEDEIKAARATAEMSPLFTTAEAAGMTPTDWQTYQRTARRAVEEAEKKLLEKTMAKIRREQEAWFKEERKNVTKEVTDDLRRRPVYRLTELLANGVWHGAAEDFEAPDMRMDRKALVDMFGAGVLEELRNTRGKRAIYKDDGLSPEEVARYFDFNTPGEMIEALQNAPKLKEAIRAETERRLDEMHGDPLNDGTIEQLALEAIHADQQQQSVVQEARALAKRAGKPTKNIKARIYQAKARRIIGQMPVHQASKPLAFLRAEQKAAREAQAAFAKVVRGGAAAERALADAQAAKERQVLNGYLYREAREFERELGRKREKMRSFDKTKVRQAIGEEHVNQIDFLLARFDFRQASQKEIDQRVDLRDYIAEIEAQGLGDRLAIDERFRDEAFRKHYTRMTVDEVRGLWDTVENIAHIGRNKTKLIYAQQKADLNDVAQEVGETFEKNRDRAAPPRFGKTRGQKAAALGRQTLNLVLNADTLLREIDGWEDMGAAWRAIAWPIKDGMSRLTKRREAMARDLDAIFDAYTTKEKSEMGRKIARPELGGEAASKWDIIAMALNTGNRDNWLRMTDPRGIKTFDQQAVNDILRKELDDRDWKTVQSVLDYINSYWPEIEAKERRNTGFPPKKVQADVMTDAAPDWFRGGYYPIKYDPQLAARTDDLAMKDLANELMAGKFGKAQTANGHTKERKAAAQQALQLDIGIVSQHLSAVLYDLEIGEAVTGAWRIIQHSRVRDAFYEADRKSDHEALELWVKDTAAGDGTAAGYGAAFLRHLRSGFVLSKLAINIGTVLIQPTGLVQSGVVIGQKNLAAGLTEYMRNRGRWVEDVTAVSPLMAERRKTFQRDIMNVFGDFDGDPVAGRYKKFMRDVALPLSFYLMGQMQFHVVDMPTWVGAYNAELKKSGDENKARAYADLMVERAQGSGLISSRGMLERGTTSTTSRQQELPKLLTALGSYMFAKGNVAYERTMRTQFKDPVQAMLWAADMALLFTLEAVLYSVVKGQMPEEDENEAWWLFKQTGLSVMGTMPLVREAASGLQGYSTGGTQGAILETLTKPMLQAAQGEIDKTLVKSLVNAGGMLLHAPSSATNYVLDSFLDDDLGLKPIEPAKMIGIGTGKRSLMEWMTGEQ